MERVEARGLVEVSADGRRLEARLAHPLYGEVQRARCGRLRARRLRGRIADALASTGGRRMNDTLRRAVLAVDSDLVPDAALLTTAAARAVELLDQPLAIRLARAGVSAGGGFESRLLLAYALGWDGRGPEAEAEFVILTALAKTDAERARVAVPRAGGLFFPHARPVDADVVLAAAERSVIDSGAAAELKGMRSVLDACLARPVRSTGAAADVLAAPNASATAVVLAGWGAIMACGDLGRLEGLEETVRLAYVAAGSAVAAHIRTAVADMWVRALILGGRFDLADAAVQEFGEPFGDIAGPAQLFVEAMQGRVARDRGLARTAARLQARPVPVCVMPTRVPGRST